MMINDNFDLLDEQDEVNEPYWTLQRFVYTLIILITLIAFIVYVLSPLFLPSTPPVMSPLPRHQA